MGHVWSDAKSLPWLDVELAATETLADAGLVPKEAAATIRENAKTDVTRIHEIEARVKHDVIAFTMAVGETIGDPAARAGCTTASPRTISSTPRRPCRCATLPI